MERRTRAAVVPQVRIRSAVECGAGAVEKVVGIEWIYGKRCRHPANLWVFDGAGSTAAGACWPGRSLKPWRHRDVLRIDDLVSNTRITSPVPNVCPRRTTVGAAEDISVRPPGAMARHHDHVRVGFADREAIKAEKDIARARGLAIIDDRVDVRPRAAADVVFPDLTFLIVVRSSLHPVGYVHRAADRLDCCLGRHDSRSAALGYRLASHCSPIGPTIAATVDTRRVLSRHADIDVLRDATNNCARIEDHPPQALLGRQVTIRIARILNPIAHSGKAVYLRPGAPAVGAFPQAESGVCITGCPEIDDVAVVGIDG